MQGDILDWTVYSIPIIADTEREVGTVVLTSVVSLAMTQKLTNIIEYDNMVSFVKAWAPRNYLEENLKAIDLGYKLIENCVPLRKG